MNETSPLELRNIAEPSSIGDPRELRYSVSRLTPREAAILGEMMRGLKNADIATHLGIGPETVKTHISHIFDKLGAHSRSELIARLKG